MLKTVRLRQQHENVFGLMDDIVRMAGQSPDPDTFAITIHLARLTATLRIHFAIENKWLYPLLNGSADGEATAVAPTFQHEMEGLAQIYESFAAKWAASATIDADVAGFRRESATVFGALKDRMARENEQLYRVAERIDPTTRALEPLGRPGGTVAGVAV